MFRTPKLVRHESPAGPYWYHPDHPDCQDGRVLHEEPSDTPRTDEAAFVAGPPNDRHDVVTVVFAEQLERELAASQAGQANALELLREIRDDEVNAQDEADKFLRDNQPSKLSEWQAEAARLSAEREHNANLAGMWQALAEGLAGALKDCKNRAMDKSIETHADDHAKGCVDDIWEWAESALAAYEAATAGGAAKKTASPLDEPPGPA